MIGLSALVVGGTLFVADVERHGSPPATRQWVALSAAYLVAALLADLRAGGLGGGLATLLMASVLLARGDDVLRYFGVQLGDKRQPANRVKSSTNRATL